MAPASLGLKPSAVMSFSSKNFIPFVLLILYKDLNNPYLDEMFELLEFNLMEFSKYWVALVY